jgi:hypothetical protein
MKAVDLATLRVSEPISRGFCVLVRRDGARLSRERDGGAAREIRSR